MKSLIVLGLVLATAVTGWCQTKKAESAAGSAARGGYLAASGVISPANEVLIDSYIGAVDYRYPRLPQEITVTTYIGNRQVSSAGQEEVVQVGIQGPEAAFEDLAAMNLVFVIDHSGSMGGTDKLPWVKKAFEVFIRRVRDRDFVSLVVFNDSATVLFPSTRMDTPAKREQFAQAARGIPGGGGTNLLSGLRLGYEQAMMNFRADYTNRVLFLTDGNDNVDHVRQMMEMAKSYKQMGINVSTIGVGRSFDLQLMNDLARQGGGSSRFIADTAEMEEMFGTDLDRTIVPAGRNLRMTLQLEPGVKLAGTWGYGNSFSGSTISYELPTLHNRDYETILAAVRIAPGPPAAARKLARFSLQYQDLEGRSHSMGPYPIEVEVVAGQSPVTGFSDGMVLRSGTMLHFAQTLARVGELYYAARAMTDAGAKAENLHECLDLTLAMKRELVNARLRLDSTGFDKEIVIADQYLKILGTDLALTDEEASRIAGDVEIAPPVPERSLDENLGNLFREVILNLRAREGGAIAVSGFSMKRDTQPQLCALLDERGLVELSRVQGLTPVERRRLDAVLREQEIALSDLADTEKAIAVGKVLAARYILTGSIIEMPGSLVIFARIVNVETSEVESAAQVIVPKNREVSGLL
jgi:Mg-chelatase subunit ChlD